MVNSQNDEDKKFEEKEKQHIPSIILKKTLDWNKAHGVDTTGGINTRIREGSFPDLILEGDAFYAENVRQAAEAIIAKRDTVRIAIIAGPSSSGKTTTTIKINEHLEKEGMSIKPITVDNYFFNLEMHPKDEFGDYDFETPQALDLELINQHLSDLIEGKTVQVPRYNFKSGVREEVTDPLTLEDNQILLIDSLHGLYEGMTSSVSRDLKFRLYIETLSQTKDNEGNWVRWCDIRMLRRMVRDSWHRSYDPVMTIGHWHYVRKSEMAHIVPFIDTVDFVVNGSLPYELPVHKKHMFPYFDKAMKEFDCNSKRRDACIRTERVMKLLNEVEVWEDDSVIPGKSLMREYIGGGEYDY